MERLTRAQAIRAKCLDCCCDQSAEVRRCAIKTCALWRFRMGAEERDILYTPRPPRKKKPSIVDK